VWLQWLNVHTKFHEKWSTGLKPQTTPTNIYTHTKHTDAFTKQFRKARSTSPYACQSVSQSESQAVFPNNSAPTGQIIIKFHIWNFYRGLSHSHFGYQIIVGEPLHEDLRTFWYLTVVGFHETDCSLWSTNSASRIQYDRFKTSRNRRIRDIDLTSPVYRFNLPGFDIQMIDQIRC